MSEQPEEDYAENMTEGVELISQYAGEDVAEAFEKIIKMIDEIRDIAKEHDITFQVVVAKGMMTEEGMGVISTNFLVKNEQCLFPEIDFMNEIIQPLLSKKSSEQIRMQLIGAMANMCTIRDVMMERPQLREADKFEEFVNDVKQQEGLFKDNPIKIVDPSVIASKTGDNKQN